MSPQEFGDHREVSVEEGLSPGDTIIYENNLGLSHMNLVIIEN